MNNKNTVYFLLLFYQILLFDIINAQPSIMWKKTYGGSEFDGAYSIKQTYDDGYVVAGFSNSKDGDVSENANSNEHYWVLKLDKDGDIEWEKTYGSSSADYAHDIQQTSDKGYIVVGNSNGSFIDFGQRLGKSDYGIIKLDSIGNVEWEKAYGGDLNDIAEAVQQTKDGGYIVAGRSESESSYLGYNNGYFDFWILKLNSIGVIDWKKHYGGIDDDKPYSMTISKDGGYVIAGYTRSKNIDLELKNGFEDFWVIKIDNIGNIIWEKTYGGTSNERAHSIKETNEGGFIIAGWSESNDQDVGDNYGEEDYWVIKLDSEGNLEWEQNYGGWSSDKAESIYQTNDGGYVVAGSSFSDNKDIAENNGGLDFWILKLDSLGYIDWERNYGGSYWEWANTVIQDRDGNIIVAGQTGSSDKDVESNKGAQDLWIIKINPTSVIGSSSPININNSIKVYPNPSNGEFIIDNFDGSIDVCVYDVSGKIVITKEKIKNHLNFRGFKVGKYLIKITKGKNSYMEKIIIY